MTLFIICAALITAATLALLIWPLKRTRNTISYERHAQNIHFARERLEELESQLNNAAISATAYESLKLEIESTLAHDLDIANSDKHRQQDVPRRSNKAAISLLVICLPLSAIGFYFLAGTPEAIELKASHSNQLSTQNEIDSAIGDIEQRLINNPDDLGAWQAIARPYLALGQYANAENAYRQILRLEGDSAETYASLADTLGLKANGQINDQSLSFALKALSLNPSNRQALWLAGLGSAQRSNMADARKHWGNLVPLLDGVPQQQQELRDIIAQSFQETGEQQATGNSSDGLQVTVSLSPEMAALADPDDVVFVFAKAKQGPPAPLAAKKLKVSDLPTSLSLSDADAMIAQLTISKFEDIVVSARVSKSRQPISQIGDLESVAIDTKNDSQENIDIIISYSIK
jgi:cytochrome c-type biogenesis protein CcmH